MAAGPGEAVSDLVHASLWGLVRSAQSENPAAWCWPTWTAARTRTPH
ncbi:hypothetical protein GXW82_14755 [Streptacidiphilus sp. 4-A2]|nr:hypothetical protein [Streptacidiphilus sp. 4-A2]